MADTSSTETNKDIQIPNGEEEEEDTVSETEEPEAEVCQEYNECNEYNEYNGPSMSIALFVFWIIPILILAVISRIGVDTEPPAVTLESKPISITLPKPVPKPPVNNPIDTQQKKQRQNAKPKQMKKQKPMRGSKAYQAILKELAKRTRVSFPKPHTSNNSKTTPTPSVTTTKATPNTASKNPTTITTPTRHPKSQDAQYNQALEILAKYRAAQQADPIHVLKALNVADTLRRMDLTYHDGGSRQVEALEMYQHAIDLVLKQRAQMIANNEPTNVKLGRPPNVPDEIMVDNTEKSVDGLLCSIYTNKGKQYFMANMFEKAAAEYTNCITIEPLYLDAVGSRATTLMILGQYNEAGIDFQTVMEHDKQRMFNDVFTGMAKLLSAKESAVPTGWGPMVEILHNLIPTIEANMAAAAAEATGNAMQDDYAQKMFAETLTRLYHAMFMYHDSKTKDVEQAWRYLETGFKYKMSVLTPYPKAFEQQKLATIKGIFQQGFWPDQVGSQTDAPIFIIGFVRSGSTLLERVLDAHPLVVGTGEDSVFNGRLDEIRNTIVSVSMSGEPEALVSTVQELADSVVDDMRARWKVIESNTVRDNDDNDDNQAQEPLRFADKMLTNYFNVGFIHMLFPKALILHVARNPMDTIFSAFKHEFPPGGLDYTSEFSGLAHMYRCYREVIEHWDNVLPGRVTHVRYEDMVHDMPGMARAIINAAGLPWNDSVLQFHKKKHATNTLSTTQVRQGVYNHSLEAWKTYEQPLQPLVKLVGDLVEWNLKTTLPTYAPANN